MNIYLVFFLHIYFQIYVFDKCFYGSNHLPLPPLANPFNLYYYAVKLNHQRRTV